MSISTKNDVYFCRNFSVSIANDGLVFVGIVQFTFQSKRRNSTIEGKAVLSFHTVSAPEKGYIKGFQRLFALCLTTCDQMELEGSHEKNIEKQAAPWTKQVLDQRHHDHVPFPKFQTMKICANFAHAKLPPGHPNFPVWCNSATVQRTKKGLDQLLDFFRPWKNLLIFSSCVSTFKDSQTTNPTTFVCSDETPIELNLT